MSEVLIVPWVASCRVRSLLGFRVAVSEVLTVPWFRVPVSEVLTSELSCRKC